MGARILILLNHFRKHRIWVAYILSAAKGDAYAKMKRPEEAINVLQELISLSTENYVSPYTIATVYAGLGDIDSALKWLQKTVNTRSFRLADPFTFAS